VCDLETSRMGAPYIYDISRLRVNYSITKGPQTVQIISQTNHLTFVITLVTIYGKRR